jgi:KDO2-lipid IV(A) lauroyltransferase
MKKMTDFLTYLLFRALVFFFRYIPFRLMYIFSDMVYLLFYYVTGYRKKVVFSNLRNSFPGKNPEEVRKIAKGFYHHLCDLLFESLKSFSMTEDQVISRYPYDDAEVMDRYYREGKNVIVIAGHYSNWEWTGIASGKQILHIPVGFYKPLSNRYVDEYMKKTRVQGRSMLASIMDTSRTFTNQYPEPAAFYMVADQSPASPRLAYWVRFMNQDTPVLHGPEKYARLHNLPVIYTRGRKISRGHYRLTFELVTDDPGSMRTGELTEAFMQRLESNILENPDLYLWSHRRWKLKREIRS